MKLINSFLLLFSDKLDDHFENEYNSIGFSEKNHINISSKTSRV